MREWLLSLNKVDRKIVGEDVKTVQFGWPLGMPLVRKLEADLWEVRSRIGNGIARVVFTVHGQSMILLHGFVKKTRKTPATELATSRKRLAQFKEHSS